MDEGGTVQSSDLEVEVGSRASMVIVNASSNEPGAHYLPFPGAETVGPHICTHIDFRPRHHDLLSIIPMHLAPASIYLLRYASSLPSVDGGKFALGLYVLFATQADFAIPKMAKTNDPVIPLDTMISTREAISRLYLATSTYLFMIWEHDIGYELGIQFDAMVHSRGPNAVFNIHRTSVAMDSHFEFKRAPVEGGGNPFLTNQERFWFLAAADKIIQRHADALRQPIDEYHDALFSVICRFANNRPVPFPVMPAVGNEVV